VPYGGGGPAIQAVLSNTSHMTLLSYAALKGHIQSGKMKPLAVTGATRLPDLPDVPTVAESGYPGFGAYSFIGIFVPSATPATTVQQLTADFKAVLADADVRKKLTDGGFEVMATDGPTLERYTRAEYERWRDFVKATGLKIDD
jgi:tripartite-type tricarboxylate transporter receptor subunit TctC